jgi:hypothetical protein
VAAAARPLTRGLHQEADNAQAERAGNLKRLAAARKLESQGTTAKREEWQRNPEWLADLEYVWRMRTADARERLETRARARFKLADHPDCAPAHRVELLRSAEWSYNRARALAMPREDVVNTCRRRWRKIACACRWRELQVGCDAPQLCASCRKKHWWKWRKRITKSMRTHVAAARSAWNLRRQGMLPGVYLLTLTGPHSGDLVVDRRRLGNALRELLKVGRARGWWTHYAATWEATAGDDGLGHLHIHMACVSSWIPYEELHAAWRAAMPGALVLHVSAPSAKHGRKDAGRAANYLAKYVTKGIEPAELTGRKAGELLVAFRGKRKVTTSRHFWMREVLTCRDCGCQHRQVEAPCSLQTVAPGAVFRALQERSRWRPPRGSPQVMLRVAGLAPA